MSLNLGNAYVEIQPDFDDFHRKVAAEIPALQRRFQGLSTSQSRSTQTTSRLSRATSGLGGTLARAAGAAAGAAAAYVSISQAKAAIDTTEGLAKASQGLSRNLGLSVKEASRWGAVAIARDIDTKSLTMSFTTLSRQLVDASRGSETAIQSFKDIGVSQRDLKQTNGDFTKQLLAVADGFGEAEGGALRQQAAQKLLGRGYQTLLPLFAEGSKSLQEQLHWADEYGVTLNKRTIGPINDLISAQRESKEAWLGIQVTFTQMVAPALEVANRKFQSLARVMGNDKLTNAEKFQKIAEKVGHWATVAKDAFIEDALPKIVEGVGRSAPEIAKALVQGFLNSPVLGKLFLGGLFLSKIGGLGALDKLGGRMGGRMGGAVGPAFMAGLSIWALANRQEIIDLLVPKGAINDAFHDAFDDLAPGAFLDEFNDGFSLDATDNALKAWTERATLGLIDLRDAIDPTQEDLAHLRVGLLKTDSAATQMGLGLRITKSDFKTAAQGVGFFADALDRTQREIRQFERQVERSNDNVGDSVKDAGRIFDTNAGRIRDDLDKTGDGAKRQGDVFANVWGGMSKRSGKLAKNVTANNANMTNAVGDGLGVLRDNVLAATKEFGLKSKFTYSIKKADKAVSTVTNLLGAQKGAIVPGTGSGDTVPLHVGGQLAAMVEPGELVSVANRKATAAMMQVNEKIPRFQGGGLVPHLAKGGMTAMLALANKYERKSYPYLWGGGHGDFANAMSPVDCSGAVSDILHAGGLLSGAPMVSGALMGWGKPAKGGEPLVVYANPHHTVMSLNGKTFGTSGSNPGGGAGWIEGGNGASLAPGAKRTMGVMAELARVILQGPAGRQKKLGQAGLDRVWKAGKSYLAKQSPMGAAGGGDWGPVGDAIVKGRATWFTGGQMASGRNTDVDPGIALNPNPGGPDPGSWDNPTTQRWLADAQQFLVSIGGKQTALPVLDMGPAGWTGNAIDVDRAGVSKLGFSTSSFPSGTVGTARIIKRRLGGLVPHLTKGSKKPLHAALSGGHTDPAWRRFEAARRISEKLAELLGDKGRIARIDERIGMEQTLAGLDSSELGSDLGPGERAKQIRLNEQLLAKLVMARKLAHSGIGLTNVPKGMPVDRDTERRLRGLRRTLNESLLGLVGVTGKGGRIFDAKIELDTLKHTSTASSSSALDIGGLRSVIEAARYGVFDNQLPRFHEGGTYRAPIGRNEGPAILKDGETVSPAGGIEVTNNWSWDGFDLVVETEINGALAKRERKRYQRARQRA